MKNPLVRVGAGMVLSFGLLTSSGCGGSRRHLDVVQRQQPQVVEPEGVKSSLSRLKIAGSRRAALGCDTICGEA